MDFGKYLAIFCVSLIIVQTECRSLNDDNENNEIVKLDYEDDDDDNSDNETVEIFVAQEAIELLTDILKITAETGIKTIRDLENGIKIIQTNIINDAADAVNLLGDTIIKKMDELKEKAEGIAVTIIDCIENREADIKQILIVFLNKTADCATDRVNDVMDGFAELLGDIDTVGIDLQTAMDQYHQCRNDTDAKVCELEFELKVLADLEKWENQISEDVKKAEQLVDQAEDYLFECYHDNYNIMEITAMEVYNGVEECIFDKLNNTIIVNS